MRQNNEHRKQWAFIEKINKKVGFTNMQYKRSNGKFVDVGIYKSVGEEVINKTIKSFVGFGFKVERRDDFEVVRLFLTW
jgi:hypothetical protein